MPMSRARTGTRKSHRWPARVNPKSACVPSNLMVTYAQRMVTSVKTGGAATRNPGRTRERILSAALKEFAAKGFAGARVDTIARRAAINKRMLYHYFGG